MIQPRHLIDTHSVTSTTNERFIIETPTSEWDEELSIDLDKLCVLPRGWDGYGSEPVSFTNAADALKILSKLKSRLAYSNSDVQKLVPCIPFLVPVSGGALQAEWHLDDYFVEFFFDSPEFLQVFAYSESSDWTSEFEIDLSSNQIDISQIINCFAQVEAQKQSL